MTGTRFPQGLSANSTAPSAGNVTADTFTGDLTGDVTGDLTGNVTGATQIPVDTSGTAAGAIAIGDGDKLVLVGGSGSVALTLAEPTAGTDDGKIVRFTSLSAHDSTITPGTVGFNAGNDTIATLGGAIGDGLTVVAYNGEYYILSNINATIA
jgi:hypothetical protein